MVSKLRQVSLLLVCLVILLGTVNIAVGSNPSSSFDERSANSVLLYVGSPNSYVHNQNLLLSADDLSVTPIRQNGKVMIPLDFFATVFGFNLERDINTGTVVLKHDDGRELFRGGSDFAGYAPLDYLAAATGHYVFYYQDLVIISVQDALFDAVADKARLDQLIRRQWPILTINNQQQLSALVAELNNERFSLYANENVKFRYSTEVAQQLTGVTATADFSSTNVQVQGVDEGDQVKTDGRYIYQLKDRKLVITQAVPATQLQVVNTIEFNDPEFRPEEIYLNDRQLIVIGQTTASHLRSANVHPVTEPAVAEKSMIAICPPYYPPSTTAYIYDAADKSALKLTREVTVEGRYISSRRIEQALYLVTSSDLYSLAAQDHRPGYRDTATGGDFAQLDFSRLFYFPVLQKQQNYLLTTSIMLDQPERPAAINAYLGGGETIYVSSGHLYVAAPASSTFFRRQFEPATSIYKFALTNGDIVYQRTADVPGTLLNQFAMDEYQGFLRLATTSYNRGQSNNLFICDEDLTTIGSITNIAPDERIYSVRFMGDRAYMVTFKTVDPLFAIDVSDPYQPQVLGALKIPGFSNYLHPYDEHHLIGFGKNTVEQNGRAYDVGMKIALFDVTDINNPIERFVEIIGARGTTSPLLTNHHALLFRPQTQLLALPIQATHAKPGQSLMQGQFAGQGAYIYKLDLQTGFKLTGIISHLNQNADQPINDYQRYVQRILYIDNNLYTISDKVIMAHQLPNLKPLSQLQLTN